MPPGVPLHEWGQIGFREVDLSDVEDRIGVGHLSARLAKRGGAIRRGFCLASKDECLSPIRGRIGVFGASGSVASTTAADASRAASPRGRPTSWGTTWLTT